MRCAVRIVIIYIYFKQLGRSKEHFGPGQLFEALGSEVNFGVRYIEVELEDQTFGPL